jgi:predicted AAA+ superfamily ATPase
MGMIERNAMKTLDLWKNSTHRKPLVLRGARQVGKTALVREFGKRFKRYVEFNFDENPEKGSLFKGVDIEGTIRLIEADIGSKLLPGDTLLFFDEVQSAPEVLPMLRYFYEKRPDLHVVAAGSLLEFLLADHTFSMPVGRIEYCFLAPLTFEEFLGGLHQGLLLSYLESFDFSADIPQAIHRKLLDYLQVYFLVGGMPEAMSRWFETEDFVEVQKVHASILQTYEDDFAKYRKRINPDVLRMILKKIPALVGGKVRYTKIDPNTVPSSLNAAIRALSSARVMTQIFHSAGNGIPLGAEVNEKKFKPLFLDVGLYSTSLSLRLLDLHNASDLLLVNSGACAEQFVGQQLLAANPTWIKPELFYWHREKKGSNAEVDYLVNSGPTVLPIEVKAGKTGSLRSLHTFMALKQSKLALRFNTDRPSITEVSTEISQVGKADYRLLSLPLYMTGQATRLLAATSA